MCLSLTGESILSQFMSALRGHLQAPAEYMSSSVQAATSVLSIAWSQNSGLQFRSLELVVEA
jgi:hypothetical protein